MSNRKINSIGLIALLLVVAIPLAYSATEPSVIVNMSSTQTEKPIQVKDHLGSEVFSVDTDGTVFPSQGISVGTEVTVLDKSGFDDGVGQPFSADYGAYEFTMPTDADLYRISAIEWKFGNTVGGQKTCAGVGEAVGTKLSGFTSGDYSSLIGVATAQDKTLANGFDYDQTVNTIVKAPAVSLPIQGGATLIAYITNCDGSLNNYAGDTATESFDEITGDLHGTDENGIGAMSGFTEFQSNGYNYYMKVYAEPLE